MSFLHLDLPNLIRTIGYFGLLAITFAESGLLIGFCLPGDSLLFTAGFLASQHYLNIYLIMLVSCIGAIVGDSVGYAFGKKVGPKLFTREDSFFFHRDHIQRAEKFYERHGGKALILARFMPIVRTFAPIVAGVGKMPYKKFILYNIIGGLLWGISLPLLGYFLGTLIPDADKYIQLIVVGIIVVSLLPSMIHILKVPSNREKIIIAIKNLGKRNQKKAGE